MSLLRRLSNLAARNATPTGQNPPTPNVTTSNTNRESHDLLAQQMHKLQNNISELTWNSFNESLKKHITPDKKPDASQRVAFLHILEKVLKEGTNYFEKEIKDEAELNSSFIVYIIEKFWLKVFFYGDSIQQIPEPELISLIQILNQDGKIPPDKITKILNAALRKSTCFPIRNLIQKAMNEAQLPVSKLPSRRVAFLGIAETTLESMVPVEIAETASEPAVSPLPFKELKDTASRISYIRNLSGTSIEALNILFGEADLMDEERINICIQLKISIRDLALNNNSNRLNTVAKVIATVERHIQIETLKNIEDLTDAEMIEVCMKLQLPIEGLELGDKLVDAVVKVVVGINKPFLECSPDIQAKRVDLLRQLKPDRNYSEVRKLLIKIIEETKIREKPTLAEREIYFENREIFCACIIRSLYDDLLYSDDQQLEERKEKFFRVIFQDEFFHKDKELIPGIIKKLFNVPSPQRTEYILHAQGGVEFYNLANNISDLHRSRLVKQEDLDSDFGKFQRSKYYSTFIKSFVQLNEENMAKKEELEKSMKDLIVKFYNTSPRIPAQRRPTSSTPSQVYNTNQGRVMGHAVASTSSVGSPAASPTGSSQSLLNSSLPVRNLSDVGPAFQVSGSHAPETPPKTLTASPAKSPGLRNVSFASSRASGKHSGPGSPAVARTSLLDGTPAASPTGSSHGMHDSSQGFAVITLSGIDPAVTLNYPETPPRTATKKSTVATAEFPPGSRNVSSAPLPAGTPQGGSQLVSKSFRVSQSPSSDPLFIPGTVIDIIETKQQLVGFIEEFKRTMKEIDAIHVRLDIIRKCIKVKQDAINDISKTDPYTAEVLKSYGQTKALTGDEESRIEKFKAEIENLELQKKELTTELEHTLGKPEETLLCNIDKLFKKYGVNLELLQLIYEELPATILSILEKITHITDYQQGTDFIKFLIANIKSLAEMKKANSEEYKEFFKSQIFEVFVSYFSSKIFQESDADSVTSSKLQPPQVNLATAAVILLFLRITNPQINISKDILIPICTANSDLNSRDCYDLYTHRNYKKWLGFEAGDAEDFLNNVSISRRATPASPAGLSAPGAPNVSPAKLPRQVTSNDSRAGNSSPSGLPTPEFSRQRLDNPSPINQAALPTTASGYVTPVDRAPVRPGSKPGSPTK